MPRAARAGPRRGIGSGAGTPATLSSGAFMSTRHHIRPTDLGDSRVRVEVEVDTEALEREVRQRRRRDRPRHEGARLPQGQGAAAGGAPAGRPRGGARRGRSPRAARAGTRRRSSDAGIATVGEPQRRPVRPAREGRAAGVHLRGRRAPARPSSATTRASRSAAASPRSPRRRSQAELERMRESLASLETVERAAADGDFVVIDFVGSVDGEPFEGGEARGFLLELGSGRLIPGFEEQLVGRLRGRRARGQGHLPRGLPGRAAGRQGGVVRGRGQGGQGEAAARARRRLRRGGRRLSTRSTSCARRSRTQLREAQEAAIEREFREAAVDAVGGAGQDRRAARAGAREGARDVARDRRAASQRRGSTPQQYLQMTGKTEEELVTESEPDAERALEREAVLAAVVEAEGIEVSDEEMLDALREARRAAGRAGAERQGAAAGRSRRPARRAPTRRCARTSRCARRWT